MADIALDAASAAPSSAAGTTRAWNHTVSAGDNRLLHVGTAARSAGGADAVPSSVTFNSIALTAEAGADASAAFGTFRSAAWYLVDPPVGTFEVLVTYPNTGPTVSSDGSAISLFNVDPEAPVCASAASGDNSGAQVETVEISPTVAGAWILDCFKKGGGFDEPDPVVDNGAQTQLINTNPNFNGSFCASCTGPVDAEPITIGWDWTATATDRDAVLSAVAYAPAPDSGSAGPLTNATPLKALVNGGLVQ
jgi:hypothetical protein